MKALNALIRRIILIRTRRARKRCRKIRKSQIAANIMLLIVLDDLEKAVAYYMAAQRMRELTCTEIKKLAESMERRAEMLMEAMK